MHPQEPLVATFSIVARDPATDEWGVAVQSKFLAVGAIVPWARAGAGAVATQAWANYSFGPRGLDLLEQGRSAAEVADLLIAADEGRDHRQLGVVDRQGRAAAYTGSKCLHWAGHRTGDNYTCQGNILVSEATVEVMEQTFLTTGGHLADRLTAALAAAQTAGGDSRGEQSAALLVVRAGGGYGGVNDRLVDLRVDDHSEPIAEVQRLLEMHRQTFLTPTPPDHWWLDDPEKVRMLQSLLREVGVYDGSVSGELTFNTRGSLVAWCRQENLPEMDPGGRWVPGLTILALRRAVTDRRLQR